MPHIRVAYIDTETTGFSSVSDRIIELAIVLAKVDWDTGAILQVIDTYQSLHDPLIRIPSSAFAVHGISNAMVKGHRIDARKAKNLLSEAEICLAHSSGFDKGFVAQVVPEVTRFEWGCTCRGIPWQRLYPALSAASLQTLSNYFGCKKGTAHRAMGDVETMMHLVSLPGVHGGRAFQQLLLHKKIQRNDLEPDLVVLPNPIFQRQLSRRLR